MVWGSIIGTTISLIVLSVMSYSEYKATLKFRCLFGKEKHGCGGFRANLFLVKFIHINMFYLFNKVWKHNFSGFCFDLWYHNGLNI